MPRVVTTERPHRLRWIRSRLAYLALIAFLAFFAYTFLQKTQEIKRLSEQATALRAGNAALAADNAHVQRNIGYDRTLSYIEGRARSDLGWSKAGEFVIQSNPQWQHVAAVRSAPPRPTAPRESVWRQWLDVFTR